MGDPYFEINWLNSSLWTCRMWTYSRNFTTRASGGAHWVVFEGIKMGARIYIDGVEAGNATDQFRRYAFPVPPAAAGGTDLEHTVRVAFDPRISVGGRFMGCSGGWDWAPYTNTYNDGALTFSSGIWKSVYVVDVAPVAIVHVVPSVFYRGPDPTAPLVNGQHAGFSVAVKLFLHAQVATRATIRVRCGWGSAASAEVQLAPGENVATVSLAAAADEVQLWYPNGAGPQPLYNVAAVASVGGTDTAVATRRIGFRTFAIVTGAARPPGSTFTTGTMTNGMVFRVNGAATFSRGANVIPMEQLEGRMRADAHTQMLASAAAAGMNTVRVWGGGIFYPTVFYDVCDELGIMVYHDLMYPGHPQHDVANTTDQMLETRHNVRRLSSHPSLVIWDGENADDGGRNTGEVVKYAMTWVAEEDQSKTVWPACQSAGWLSGVDPSTSTPRIPLVPLVPRAPTANRSDGGKGRYGTDMEYHGPYQHAGGFPSVNQASAAMTFSIPLDLSSTPTGVGLNSSFISEFGSVAMSSFESMSATLQPEHWGLHGGMPADQCSRRLPNAGVQCVGGNPMSQRNYPCDTLIAGVFGTDSETLDQVGEAPFKKQLWLCMAAAALAVKSQVESYRGRNIFGLLTWQVCD